MKRTLVLLALLCASCASTGGSEPVASSGSFGGTTVYRRIDPDGSRVYWTDRGGVFVVPGAGR